MATFLGLAAVSFSDNAGTSPATSTSSSSTNRFIGAGELVVLGVGASGSPTSPSSVNVGGLALSKDEAGTLTYTGLECWSAVATSAIASGSTISVTMAGLRRDFFLFTFSGVRTSSYVNAISNGNQNAGVSNTYSLGLVTTLPGAIVRGTRWTSNVPTATAGGGFTEIDEIDNATAGQGTQWEYLSVTNSTVMSAVTLSGTPSAEMLAVGYSDVSGDRTNTSPPTVTGTLTAGSVLTASPGTWTPTPSSFSYYWQRSDDAAGHVNLVSVGSTGSTYTLAAADVGKYVTAGVIPH